MFYSPHHDQRITATVTVFQKSAGAKYLWGLIMFCPLLFVLYDCLENFRHCHGLLQYSICPKSRFFSLGFVWSSPRSKDHRHHGGPMRNSTGAKSSTFSLFSCSFSVSYLFFTKNYYHCCSSIVGLHWCQISVCTYSLFFVIFYCGQKIYGGHRITGDSISVMHLNFCVIAFDIFRDFCILCHGQLISDKVTFY